MGGEDVAVRLTVAAWADQVAPMPPHHTLTGNVTIIEAFPAPELGGTRRLWLYLPPGYDTSDRRYPVLYMHDGQNLFDVATSFAGEWEVDESLDALVREGRLPGLIVVGIDNAGDARLDEYSPWRDRQLGKGGRGDAYAAFLIRTLKPHVDRTWRTLPDAAHTGIAGSSMGGLISLYAGLRHPEVFGRIGVDIDSTRATGPPPVNNEELKASGSPSIQDVIRTSQVSIEEVQTLTRKIATLVDTLNSKKGTMGELINDPTLGKKITLIATDLQTITATIAQGKGSLGKLLNDDTLYTRANSAIDRLDKITADLDQGKGTAGKLLKDDSLYNNLNATVSNADQLVAEINAGKGALGKIAKDPAFAQKLDDTVTRLDSILRGVDEGKGTVGQLIQNRALYDHADLAMDQTQQLVKSIRDDPKKYLIIRLKLF